MDRAMIWIAISVFIAAMILIVLICKINAGLKNPYNETIEDEEQMKEIKKIKEKKYGK